MKHLLILSAFLYCLPIRGQLLQTDRKSYPYYIDLKGQEGRVYAIGGYYDVAGKGYSMRWTDTLFRQPDGSYTGRLTRIIREKETFYINVSSKKLQLSTITDSNLVNSQLNNGYYHTQYIALSEEMNKAYPLNHFTFRGAFYTWKTLPNKEMEHLQFRTFADERLKYIRDSTIAEQEKYIRLTNYIVQNIQTIDYSVLKDSLALLPAKYAGESKYYGTAIDAVAMQQPEYIFLLAEDLPEQRPLIFSCAIDNKKAFPGLKSVTGHDETKKVFLKERKFNRRMPFYAIGSAALGAAALTWAVIAFSR